MVWMKLDNLSSLRFAIYGNVAVTNSWIYTV